MSSNSSSESETGATSSKFDPMKALYSKNTKVPDKNAPMYENLNQYESAMNSGYNIIPIGKQELVQKREEEKEAKMKEEERLLAEKNKQRFAQYQASSDVESMEVSGKWELTNYNYYAKDAPIMIKGNGSQPSAMRTMQRNPMKRTNRLLVQRKVRKAKNVLTRMETMSGPLGALKECVDQRLRIKVITRNANGIRGVLHATLVAFDKQWNLALTDVLEIWKRKAPKKRKIPPGLGTPVPKGTAAAISQVPVVTETPIGGGILECTRHLPQVMVRGEHIVLVNIFER